MKKIIENRRYKIVDEEGNDITPTSLIRLEAAEDFPEYYIGYTEYGDSILFAQDGTIVYNFFEKDATKVRDVFDEIINERYIPAGNSVKALQTFFENDDRMLNSFLECYEADYQRKLNAAERYGDKNLIHDLVVFVDVEREEMIRVLSPKAYEERSKKLPVDDEYRKKIQERIAKMHERKAEIAKQQEADKKSKSERYKNNLAARKEKIRTLREQKANKDLEK